MGKKICLFCLFGLFLCTTGCMDRHEDSKLMFLPGGMCIDTKMAVEKEKEKEKAKERKTKGLGEPAQSKEIESKVQKTQEEAYVFTVNGPTLGEKAKKPTQNFIQEGRSIEQGIQAVEAATSRNVVTAHVRSIILGSEVATQGILEPLFYFYRDPMIPGNTILIIAYDTTASKLVQQPSMDDISMGTFLHNFFYSANNDLLVEKVSLGNYFREINNFPYTAVIPTFSVAGEKSYWSGLAVFQEDKMVAHLNRKDAQLLALVRNVKKRGYFFLEQKGKANAVSLIEGKTKIVPHYAQGRWHFLLRMNISGQLLSVRKEQDFSDKKRVKQLEQEIARSLEKQIETMADKIRKDYRVDVLNLGQAAYHHDPKHFKKKAWKQLFPDCEIKAAVTFRMNKIGEVY